MTNKRKNAIGCFLVENDSFLEVRDCYIKSVKDPKQIEKEKDDLLQNLDGNP